jgi:hypothetical protein
MLLSLYVIEKLVITETARLFSSRRPENCDVMQAANEIVALFPGEKMVLKIYILLTHLHVTIWLDEISWYNS